MKVLIAEDHGVVRQGLRALIENEPDIEVVGEAEDGLKVVELAKQLSPDVVLMDITMPNLNGVEAARFIREDNPDIQIIALSVHFDKHFVMEMLRAGASGYVLKSYLFDEVLRALRTVGAGQHYLSPKITEIVLDDYIPFISKAKEFLSRAPHRPGTSGCPVAGGRENDQADRASSARKSENGGFESPPSDGQAGYLQRRGTHQICDPRGIDLGRILV